MASYNDLIASSPVVLVEFYATWCPHCNRMMPVMAEIRELLGDSAEIYQLDVDQNEGVASEEDISSTPTFILYRDGRQVWRYSGEIDGNILLQKIQQFID